MIAPFLASGRSGFYLAVLTEGEVAAGDRLELSRTDEGMPTVFEIVDEARREEAAG
jgi:MOSC domain-containing protein YiiM